MYGTPLGESVVNLNLNSAHCVCDESTADSRNSLARQCIQFIFILRRRSLATCDHSPSLSLTLSFALSPSLSVSCQLAPFDTDAVVAVVVADYDYDYVMF